jgi:hypothetical protein
MHIQIDRNTWWVPADERPAATREEINARPFCEALRITWLPLCDFQDATGRCGTEAVIMVVHFVLAWSRSHETAELRSATTSVVGSPISQPH